MAAQTDDKFRTSDKMHMKKTPSLADVISPDSSRRRGLSEADQKLQEPTKMVLMWGQSAHDHVYRAINEAFAHISTVTISNARICIADAEFEKLDHSKSKDKTSLEDIVEKINGMDLAIQGRIFKSYQNAWKSMTNEVNGLAKALVTVSKAEGIKPEVMKSIIEGVDADAGKVMETYLHGLHLNFKVMERANTLKAFYELDQDGAIKALDETLKPAVAGIRELTERVSKTYKESVVPDKALLRK